MKKEIDFSKGEFEANGVKYFIDYKLSIARNREFERLQARLGFGTDFKTLHDNIGKAINLINGGKQVEGHAMLYNIYEMIAHKLEDRYDPALLICALFINKEGEDLAKYDEKLDKAKIDDWEKEGLKMNDFFAFALNLLDGFIAKWKELSQIGSNQKGKK